MEKRLIHRYLDAVSTTPGLLHTLLWIAALVMYIPIVFRAEPPPEIMAFHGLTLFACVVNFALPPVCSRKPTTNTYAKYALNCVATGGILVFTIGSAHDPLGIPGTILVPLIGLGLTLILCGGMNLTACRIFDLGEQPANRH